MSKLQTKFFWTDHVQAGERLNGTFILLGDDPIYVRGVVPPTTSDDACPSMDYNPSGGGSKARVRLDDPLFGRFRKLPVLGWVNCEKSRTGVLLERKPIRNRQHGLSDSNTMVGELGGQGMGADPYVIRWKTRDQAFTNVATDPGYASACKGEFPKLGEVITHIRPTSTIAISNLFAIFRDEEGLRWLYRLNHRIGVVSGADSLLLMDKYKFMKEELTEDPIISVQHIREF